MITTVLPEDFEPVFTVVSCFVEREDGKILLLLRSQHKSEGGKWGIPAGKIDEGEQLEAAVIRELREETGITGPAAPTFFETYYVRYPDYDYIFHVFHQRAPHDVQVRISPSEHEEYSWVTPEDALALKLVAHQDDCTKFFYFSDASR